MNKPKSPRGAVVVPPSLEEQGQVLYSYAQARAMLGGVPVSTWSWWISHGLVKPVRIGARRCFIRHEDVVMLAQGIALPKGA